MFVDYKILDISFRRYVEPRSLQRLGRVLFGSFRTTLAIYELLVLFTFALMVPLFIKLYKLIIKLYKLIDRQFTWTFFNFLIWFLFNFGIPVAAWIYAAYYAAFHRTGK